MKTHIFLLLFVSTDGWPYNPHIRATICIWNGNMLAGTVCHVFCCCCWMEYFQMSLIVLIVANKNAKNSAIEDITDIKEIKKIFRTKNNVLVLFTADAKKSQNAIKVFRESSNLIKGQGTTILVDCANRLVEYCDWVDDEPLRQFRLES